MSYLLSEQSDLSETFSQVSAYGASLQSDYSDIFNFYSVMSARLDMIRQDQQNIITVGLHLEILESDLQVQHNSLSQLHGLLSLNILSLYSDASAIGDYASQIDGVAQALESETEDLWANASDLRSDISGLGIDISDLDQHLGALTSDLTVFSESYQLDMSNIWDDVSLISDDVSDLFHRYSNLSGTADSLSGDISDIEIYTNSLSVLISGLSDQIIDLGSDIDTQSNLAVSLSGVIDDIGDLLIQQSGKIDDLSVYTDSLSDDITLQNELAVSLSGKIYNLSNTVIGLNDAIASLDLALIPLGNDITSLSNLHTDLKNTVTSVSNNLDSYMDLGKSLSVNVNSLSDTYRSLSGHVNSLSTNYNDLSTDVTDLDGKYLSYSGLVHSLSGKVDDINNVYSNLSGDVDDVTDLTNSLKSQTSTVSSNLTLLSGRLSGVSGDVSEIDSYLSALETNLNGQSLIGGVPQLVTYDWIGKRFRFEDQKGFGLKIRLSRYNETLMKLEALEPGVQVVTQKGGAIDLSDPVYISILDKGLSDNIGYRVYVKGGPNDYYKAGTSKGRVGIISLINGGTGYYPGNEVTLIQGSANSARVSITRTASPITGIAIQNPGIGYTVGNQLDVVQSSASGGKVTVTSVTSGIYSVAIPNGGDCYVVGDLLTVGSGEGQARVTSIQGYRERATSYNLYLSSPVTVGDRLFIDTAIIVVTAVANGGMSITQYYWEHEHYVIPGDLFAIYNSQSVQVGTAEVTNAVISGHITGVSIEQPGSGYSSGDYSTTCQAGAYGAVFTVTPDRCITSLSITNGGSGYFPASGIPLSGGQGQNATIQITSIGPGPIYLYSIINPGDGYTTGSCTVSGGSGNGATFNITIGCVPDSMCTINTDPPTAIYTKLATRSSTGEEYHDCVLVGYVGTASNILYWSGSVASAYNPVNYSTTAYLYYTYPFGYQLNTVVHTMFVPGFWSLDTASMSLSGHHTIHFSNEPHDPQHPTYTCTSYNGEYSENYVPNKAYLWTQLDPRSWSKSYGWNPAQYLSTNATCGGWNILWMEPYEFTYQMTVSTGEPGTDFILW